MKKILILTIGLLIFTNCVNSKEDNEKNKKESIEFLVKNKNKEDVITTESGLQYKILKEGTGKTPHLNSKVTVHYKGNFIDGEVFDSSIDRGKPSTFKVNGVIRGWTEALQLMKEGAKYRLFIPSYLAYGNRQKGPVKPYSTLIFDLELITVN